MKASNIFQKLKGAGVGNPDGVSAKKPVIKGLGVQSPAKMGKSPVKLAPPKEYHSKKDNKSTAKKNDPYAAAAKKDKNLSSYIKQRKGLDKNSDAYKKLQNKINAAYGVSKRYKLSGDGGESNTNTPTTNTSTTNTSTTDKPTTDKVTTKVTKTDTAKKNLSDAKQSVKDAKSEVKDTNKAKRIQKRADKKAKKAKRIKDEGGTRVGNFLRNTFKKKNKKAKKEDEATETSAPVKMKKSPAKKALVGKQGNLPEHLKAKIKAAPGKMKKSAAKMKKAPAKMKMKK